MAETRKDREKRLAQALRENLKRRKIQQREADMAHAPPDGERRLFRDKPLQPKGKDGEGQR